MSAVAVVGTGYVGLTTAVCLAELGHRVTGVDIDKAKMARLRSELSPALRALQRVADAGADLSSDVKEEVHQYLATSRVLRKDLEHGVRQLKTRLADLDALYEVVHGEVQDTALDVASRLRTVRTGVRVVSRLRRMLVRSRR